MSSTRLFQSKYAKDKQKQIDNSTNSQAVYLWLTNELGYRLGHSTSIIDDAISDKEITREDVQKLCKNEFIPIFKFLMERVRPTKQVVQIRNEYLADQQLKVKSHHENRKVKLEKRLSQINTNIKDEEEQIERLISRIADIEFQIRNVQGELREKKNKIYTKETFRENCKSFAIIENEYRNLLEEHKRKFGMKDDISMTQKGSETTLTIRIKKVCEKLRSFGENIAMSKEVVDENTKKDIRFLIEEMLSTFPPKLLLKSVTSVMKSASKDLMCSYTDKFVEKSDTSVEDSIQKVQRLLQQCRENHVEKFIETEAILNDIFKLKEKIQQEIKPIKAYTEKKYMHIPMEDCIIQVLNSNAALEANQVALKMVVSFADMLESQNQNLVVSRDELSTFFDLVNGYKSDIEEKQKTIQRLNYLNQLTRTNCIGKAEEISGFLQEKLFPFANHIETLGKNLDNMMMKENEKFKILNLRSAKQIKLHNDFRAISTLDIHRALDDNFVYNIKDLIHCPKYMSADRIFMTLSDLKREGIRWSSVIRDAVTTFDKNASFMQVTNSMQQAAETLKGLLDKQGHGFLSKEITRLKQEIDTIDKAEIIFQEIHDILEEREKILNGQIGNRIK
ncbi:16528_t:CDS:10 [Funneliformis caledonium]|uniref:16528_t:CDS:1 n=1 Tax=Funneliformis caledonium TaxID=1117310 RepID=A0A9N9FWD6_9GLOM|nr:16528_t:CDS:10 [Funneliformis caledonium]